METTSEESQWQSSLTGVCRGVLDGMAQQGGRHDLGTARCSQSYSSKGAPRQQSRGSTQANSSNVVVDFQHLQVSMELGEITKQKTEVIVIPVNNNLNLKTGVLANAVLKYGGRTIQDELNREYPQGIGDEEIVSTSSGKLQCRSIFHAYLYHAREGDDGRHLEDMVSKILDMAHTNEYTSISIPALGTGRLNYPAAVAARAIIEAISKFAHQMNSQSSLKLVKIVIYPKDTAVAQVFQEELLEARRGSGLGWGRCGDDEDGNDAYYEDDEDNGVSHATVGGGYRSEINHTYIYEYGSVKLRIKKGNIIEERCDAIVSGVKDTMDLSASGAVGNALLGKCGQSLQDECNQNEIHETSTGSEMANYGVVMTLAPGLKCNNIIFVSMDQFCHRWDEGIVEVLTFAESNGVKSIAMPAFGTGAKKADYQNLKKMIFSGVEKYGNSGRHSLTDVRLVLFSEELMDEFVGSRQIQQWHAPWDQDGARLFTRQKSILSLTESTDSESMIKAVVDDLNAAFSGAFQKDKITMKEITTFSKEQVRQLKQIGLQHNIRVSVHQDSGLLTMEISEGFKADRIRHFEVILCEHGLNILNPHHNHLYQAVKRTIQWQFQQNGKWRDFENMTNIELESEYQSKVKKCEISDARGRRYCINFREMKEYMLDDQGTTVGNVTKIRRYDGTQDRGQLLPDAWEKMRSGQNLLLVPLASGSEEYNKVEQDFRNGGATDQIKMIQRIQNKTLYQQYAAQKQEIESRNPKGLENEKRLFHGTSTSTVSKINANGFNRGYSGKHNASYGEGVYFATTSSYSVGYATADASSGMRQMYHSRVVVGESIQSKKGWKTLPYKPGTHIPYDSGTDGNGMYIIFHDCQAYPEYLITFF